VDVLPWRYAPETGTRKLVVVVLPDPFQGMGDGGTEEFRRDLTVGPRSKVWTRGQKWKQTRYTLRRNTATIIKGLVWSLVDAGICSNPTRIHCC